MTDPTSGPDGAAGSEEIRETDADPTSEGTAGSASAPVVTPTPEGTANPEQSAESASDDGTDAAAATPDPEAPASPEPAAATGAPPASAPRPPRAARAPGRGVRRAVAGLRLVTGAVGVLVAAAALALVVLTPVHPHTAPVPATTVKPVPAPLARVCPGALLALGDGTDATSVASVGHASVVAHTDGVPLERSTLTPSASEAQLLTTSAAASGALLSGAQSQQISTPDLRGLATAACGDASATSWLVGGATTTGRTSLIELSNPTATTATVELRIWTEQGPLDAPGLRGIVVPAGSQKVLSLAGFAENAATPVIEVRSSGGQVVATLEESILRAVDPGGIELTSSSSSSTRLVIPGVTIGQKDAVDTLRGRSDYDDLEPVIRLLDPGTKDTTVRVGIRPENGGTGSAFTIPLTAGKALDAPVDILGEGSYTITLESDAPIAAAVRASTALPLSSDPLASPISDFTWFVPAPLVDRATLVSIPALPSRLHIFNPGADTTVRLVGQGTPDISSDVPAGGSVVLDVAASGTYRVDPAHGIRMQVVTQTSGGIASYPVAPPPTASTPLVIRR